MKKAANTINMDSTTEEFISKFKGILEVALAPLKEDIQSMKTQLMCISELQKENDQLKIRVTTLEDKIESIEKGRIQAIEDEQNRAEQYSKKNNIIISGLPMQPDENTEEVVMNLLRSLHVQIRPDELLAAHRLPVRKNKEVPIIVKMSTTNRKSEIMQKGKTGNASGMSNGKRKTVFFNHHLTKRNQDIFNAARLFKKEAGYRYVWSRLDGVTCIRKDDKSGIIIIRRREDVEKLTAKYS